MTPRLEWNERFSKPGKNRVKYKSQKLSQKSGEKQEKFEGCKKHALLDKLRDGVERQAKSWLEDNLLYNSNGRRLSDYTFV